MKDRQDVERTFAWSMTLMVSAASMILALAEESRLPSALTPFLALTTHFAVDQWKLIRLPLWGTNILGVIAFGAMAYEFIGSDVLTKLFSGAHLLVYMTWVLLLMPKGIRQYWWLLALGVLQISVASVLTTSGSFGAALVGMLLLMTWTTSVFTLFRARQRQKRSGTVEDSLAAENNAAASTNLVIRDGLQLDDREPWIGWRFRFIVGFTFLASLAVAGVTFAAFPRIWVNESPLAGLRRARQGALSHQTGFTDEVKLGEIGEIMQSDARALQFEITRMSDGVPVSPEEFANAMRMDEILFRGNALGRYRDGRWTSERSRGTGFSLPMAVAYSPRPEDSDFRVRITQDPPIDIFAFAPNPVSNAKMLSPGELTQRPFSYSVVYRPQERGRQRRSEPLQFEIWCQKADESQREHSPARQVQRDESFFDIVRNLHFPSTATQKNERDYAVTWCITRNIDSRLPSLYRLAHDLCKDGEGGLITPRERIRRILSHLNASGRFTYSHSLSRSNRSLDPVEDFLLNLKSGHCEYFASAAALLLQAVDVPARVVNGYKGSDLNSVSGRYEVKQRYAHTWVEAYIDRNWETYDPTPAAPREEIVGQTSQLDWWTDLRSAFDDNWASMVQKMSLQRQEAMIRPWLESVKNLWEQIKKQGIAASLKMFYEEVILQPGKWVSVSTGIITFLLLLIPSLIVRVNPFKVLARKITGILEWLNPRQSPQKTVIRFYDNFRTACARHGLEFPSHQTAQENATMATSFFREKLIGPDDGKLPIQIAETFNSVRFGRHTLSTEVVAQIRSDVSRFAELISARQA